MGLHPGDLIMPIEVLYDYIVLFFLGRRGESFTVGKIMLAIIVPVSSSRHVLLRTCLCISRSFKSADPTSVHRMFFQVTASLADMFNHHFQF